MDTYHYADEPTQPQKKNAPDELSEIDLTTVCHFEVWEASGENALLTLRTPSREKTFTVSLKEALRVAKELFRLHPGWRNKGYYPLWDDDGNFLG